MLLGTGHQSPGGTQALIQPAHAPLVPRDKRLSFSFSLVIALYPSLVPRPNPFYSSFALTQESGRASENRAVDFFHIRSILSIQGNKLKATVSSAT